MRAYGYVRVSKERDGMLSPDIQRDAIDRYCAQKGYQVLEYFVDLDLSGRLPPERRPALQQLLIRAQAGECDVVVVYRVDRLSREPADYYAIMAVLKDAHVVVDAAMQPRDDSPESTFLWDLNAILARYESIKLGARIKDMHRQLARAGRWHGGFVPYGWRREEGEAGARLVADPTEAQWRLWMHERYQQGWSVLRIARYLNDHGVPTKRPDGRWADGTVYAMLRSVYQVGARMADGELAQGGNVEPIIGQEVYERTIAMMGFRHSPRGRTSRHSLTGRLVRCGTCGGGMYSRWHGRVPTLTCFGRRLGKCTLGASIRLSILTPFVEERLFRRLGHARAPKMRSDSPDLAPLVQELEKAKQALGRLVAMRAEDLIGEDEYQSARTLQRKRVEKLTGRLDAAAARVEGDAKDEFLADAWEDLGRLTRETWSALAPAAQRDILELVTREIIVHPVSGHDPCHMPVEKRVRIHWR